MAPTEYQDPARILPGLDRDNRPFWTGGEQGRLLICRCGACGYYVHPPSPQCPSCASRALAHQPATGRGRVASFTVNHQPWVPMLRVPFVFAAVELKEQPQLYVFANIVDCEPDDVRIGLSVEVVFEAHEDVFLPMFRPVRGPR